MTIGVGGASQVSVLNTLRDMTAGARPIEAAEYQQRIVHLQVAMRAAGISAMVVNAGSNLRYFTGIVWKASERLVVAVIPARGPLHYVAPTFETGTMESFMQIEGALSTWEEHASPYDLLGDVLRASGASPQRGAAVAVCPSLPFFMFDSIRRANPEYQYADAGPLIDALRMRKSMAEIDLLKRAKAMTLAVQQATASILEEGISTSDVTEFIRQAHRRVGAPGSTFCIVLFGPDTAFPHGVMNPKSLESGDMVLIDTGCQLDGYQSDITRSYVFGNPTAEQRRVWNAEKTAQMAVFEAARLGACCGDLDAAARRSLEADGFGPGYALPGLPHRTGHGIGLDLHEAPYLVGGNEVELDTGMCVSNEPTICVPGAFGIRLEDHFYMDAQGPRWFTQPSHSIDDPFGLEA
ncbi:M24 family metallopeptidase [Pseudomonas matsuisoli]|uniref:Metallopeptidase n=1 Tax=Pseudomonas matsuisoli TaxID=1515666 RepID=A0A917Q2I1_9PSED|nr:Xaa-Pro peptidase family protein [Pseudomonas matsuisoli]GGK08246.1 metallopeptidase [Pseudomonas matsuisoli]